MTTPAHAPLGTASDSLLVQVDVDNVLQVHNVLMKEAKDIRAVLRLTAKDLHLQPPGDDLVSGDAAPLFRTKIQQIVDLHLAHVRELEEATARLRDAARHYGFTDDMIKDSFTAHDESIGPIPLDR